MYLYSYGLKKLCPFYTFWKNLYYKTRNMAPTIYCIKYIFLPSPPSKSVSSLTTIVLDISIVYFVWKIRVKMMQEPIFSFITKVEMAKDIHLQMWKCFAIWRSKFNHNLFYGLVTYGLAGYKFLKIGCDWICVFKWQKRFHVCK